jgi:hypothetical protein
MTIKRVRNRDYVYFAYYDPEGRVKREIYIGPKNRPTTIPRALHYYKEFLDLQQGRLSKKYQVIGKYIKNLDKAPVNDSDFVIRREIPY